MSTPLVVTDRHALAQARAALTGRVAVVMTMGALHSGHAAMLREARSRADHVLATIFVNPLQFGAGEDLDRYPRTLDADLALCAAEGVEVVFTPTPDVVYPTEPLVRISAWRLGGMLEGSTRPGHFDGVLTVVCKLLQLSRPDVALFGQKDAQQLACIRAMVRDLDLGVEIVAVPTVREPDGLALSSRNRYLTEEQRQQATVLSRALFAGQEVAAEGAGSVTRVSSRALDGAPGVVLDYLTLVDDVTFLPVGVDASGPARLLVAAWVGSTRLIDNVPLVLGTPDKG